MLRLALLGVDYTIYSGKISAPPLGGWMNDVFHSFNGLANGMTSLAGSSLNPILMTP